MVIQQIITFINFILNHFNILMIIYFMEFIMIILNFHLIITYLIKTDLMIIIMIIKTLDFMKYYFINIDL
jgi:hypothetical protein